MAFLDNSGDIILDAVLTETGRRRMAQGNFTITKFAVGDDEIDYSLYDKNHPSGSAYYDLQILQTPVFEALTQINAGINYGLLPTTATDLLYLPSLKVNELTAAGVNNAVRSTGVFYLTDTSGDTGTSTSNNIVQALDNNSITKILEGNTGASHYVLFETGLDTGFGNVPVGTADNQRSYLRANNLVDSRFYAFYDKRLLSGILGLASTSTYTNDTSDNTFQGSLSLTVGTATSISIGLENYGAVNVNAVNNGIYWTTGTNRESLYSVIGGPRGAVGAASPLIKSGLDAEYTLYGTTSSTTLLTGATVDYIDTTIYVQGVESSVNIQIPVRIIRIS